MAIGVTSTFMDPLSASGTQAIQVALIFMFCSIPALSIWLYFGYKIKA